MKLANLLVQLYHLNENSYRRNFKNNGVSTKNIDITTKKAACLGASLENLPLRELNIPTSII